MVVYQINGGSTGSTGKIMFGIKALGEAQGMQVVCASPITSTNRFSGQANFYPIGTYNGRRVSELLARITGLSGCFSMGATAKLLAQMDRNPPDVVHLHTLHSSFINLPMLFRYLRKRRIPVVWTLHDCWAFTGHCPHFVSENCDKWKTACGNCPVYRSYPMSFADNSAWMHRLKKKWFTGLPAVQIATPSKWLETQVAASFLNEYPIVTLNNGIDLNVFRPVEQCLREKLGLGHKKIVLGVAYEWSYKKGLDVFQHLAERLDSNEYQIILIGTSPQLAATLDKRILPIHRTENQYELTEFYSAADVFVNPTREDTFPTVNMEALACGTPVITFDTGGSTEIPDEACGIVVALNDLERMEQEVIRVCTERPFLPENCRKRAGAFDQAEKYREYIKLYGELYERFTTDGI